MFLIFCQGAELTAIYWGSFAATRFLSIFGSISLHPLLVLILCFGLCAISGIVLVFKAESSLLILQIFIGLIGASMGPMYAAGLVWLELHVPVSNMISACFTAFGATGLIIGPIVIGQFIESFPMLLMYVTLALTLVCTLALAVAFFITLCKNKSS